MRRELFKRRIKMSNYKNIPLYTKSRAEAKVLNEIDQFRNSYMANVACKTRIEQAIRENYHENHLDTEAALEQVLEEFNEDRIEHVLANTVQYKSYDGRFQKCNKDWAESVNVIEDSEETGVNRNCYFVVDTHPVLTDAFVTRFCKRFSLGEYAGRHN